VSPPSPEIFEKMQEDEELKEQNAWNARGEEI